MVVSASGAMAPGPLTFYALLEGEKVGARRGLEVSIGHTVVELPIVFALATGLQAFLGEPFVRFFVSLVGGGVLIAFSILQLALVFSSKFETKERRKTIGGAVIMGAVFTGLNPFFILWWLTIGSKLVLDALVLASLVGVAVMYLAHVWLDYAFLGLVAHLSRKGISIVGARGYRIFLGVFAVFLLLFGLLFIVSIMLS